VQRAAIAGPLAIDPSIFNDGRLVISSAGRVGELLRVRALDDGSLITAGNHFNFLTGNDASMLRITSSGRLDYAFSGNGIAHVGARAAGRPVDDVTLDDLVIDGRGRIAAAGQFRNASHQVSAVVVRRLPDGTADPSFGDGGLITIDRAEQNTHVNPSAAFVKRDGDPPTAAPEGDGVAATDHAEPAAWWASDDHRPVALAVRPSGQIVVVGGLHAIVRLRPRRRRRVRDLVRRPRARWAALDDPRRDHRSRPRPARSVAADVAVRARRRRRPGRARSGSRASPG
jgi:hypothetical protein